LNEEDNLNMMRLPLIALNMNTNTLCWFWFPNGVSIGSESK